MSRCGICGGKISNTIVPHGAICKDDTRALSRGMCGDCLIPLNECAHRPSGRHHKRNTRQRNSRSVMYN